MDINEIFYDHAYDLGAMIMTREITEAVNWVAVSPFPAAQWLPYDFAPGEVSLFPTTEHNRVTVSGIQHRVELPALTSVS